MRVGCKKSDLHNNNSRLGTRQIEELKREKNNQTKYLLPTFSFTNLNKKVIFLSFIDKMTIDILT